MSRPALRSLICFWLASCSASVPTRGEDARVHDADLVIASLRTAYTFSDRSDRRGVEHAVELELAGAKGESDVDRSIGRTYIHTIRSTLSYRLGMERKWFDWYATAGPTLEVIEFDFRDLPNVDPDRQRYFGVRVGVEGRFHATRWLSPYLRLNGALLEAGSISRDFELGLRIHHENRFAATLGYRKWHGDYGEGLPGGFDAGANWGGLTVGIGLEF